MKGTGNVANQEENLRRKVLDAVKEYYDETAKGKPSPFKPGDRINYGGRVFDHEEMLLAVDSCLDFWLTAGKYADRFEKEFAAYLGTGYASLVNSGSSANLLAFFALTSPKLGDRAIKRGDEIITVAAGFPTTVTPIIQYGAIPVFVDVTLPSYNIDTTMLEEALTERTRAVMLAHTLGNPFDIAAVKKFCDAHNLWLVEDNCDALGSRYELDGEWGYTGTFGHLGTSSFYPPHHMTMGEGGAVYTSDPALYRIVQSYRDWGRDCWCPSGKDDTCKNRFGKRYGELPPGYDHKYVYSHFGFNLKVTEMQAAIGCAQLKKLGTFTEKRKTNFKIIKDGLKPFEDRLILPEAEHGSDPSWFGFLITVREGTGLTRDRLVKFLEDQGIQTRMLFAGNLIKHPCFDEMRKTGTGYRTIGGLPVTERIMKDTFWIGVYPGMTGEMCHHMVDTIKKCLKT